MAAKPGGVRQDGPSRSVVTRPGSLGGAVASAAAAAPIFEEQAPAHVADTLRRSRVAALPKDARAHSRPTALTSVTVSAVVLLVIAFTSVGLHANLAKNQIVLDRLRSDISIEERTNQRLRVDVAELQAPQRIVSEAQRMGMTPSSDVVFLDATRAEATTAATTAATIAPSSTVPPVH